MHPSPDSWNTPLSFPQDPHSSSVLPSAAQQNRKPRHRHSPAQLAALNDLFDKSEHPPLDQRTELATRLGMEIKTVNAWFQNKRASSKKRTKSVPSHEDNSLSIHLSSTPSSDFYRPSDADDFQDDEHPSPDYSRSTSLGPSNVSSFYTGHSDHSHFYTESDSIPRRMRMRPSPEQTDELRKLYNINPHPTTEQRNALASVIGMRYQSITNWFQNQRSLAKKKKEDEADSVPTAAFKADYPHETRHYSAFPPPSHHHSSLAFPPPSFHPSLSHGPVLRRSPSISPSMEERSPRRSSSHRNTTPYGTSATFSRPRRSRPEPYQLEALRQLYKQTSTPTIEERSALALEIGMDVGKVTNWFRNLRQTVRKRAKKSDSDDDDDDDDSFHPGGYSNFASRSGTPSVESSSSYMEMDVDDDVHHPQSDIGSEDEFQEAVTPSPECSLLPPPSVTNNLRSGLSPSENFHHLLCHAEIDKAWVEQYSGIKVEDALLLLSFHRHIVH